MMRLVGKRVTNEITPPSTVQRTEHTDYLPCSTLTVEEEMLKLRQGMLPNAILVFVTPQQRIY